MSELSMVQGTCLGVGRKLGLRTLLGFRCVVWENNFLVYAVDLCMVKFASSSVIAVLI